MLVPPQTSAPVPLDPTHSLWYESMQDMSGFVPSDTILPPLDEQLDLTISTAQIENDFYVHNPGLPSPAEFFLRDTSDDVISEESDMFDNSNSEALETKTNECQSESPIRRNPFINYLYSDQTRITTNMGDTERSLPQKNSSSRLKIMAIKHEKPKYLSLIDSEEPMITDPYLSYCNQNKIDSDVKNEVDVSEMFDSEDQTINEDMDKLYYSADMGVAEEVVVTTEEEDKCKTITLSLLDSVPSDSEEDLNIPEEKSKREADVIFESDPFLNLETVMGNLFDFEGIRDEMYSQTIPAITSEDIEEDYDIRDTKPSDDNLLSDFSGNRTLPSTDRLNNTNNQVITDSPFRKNFSNQTASKLSLKPASLTLDINAARAGLLDDKGYSDTPELLEALKPEVGKFDLIKFITTNGDPNNNAISSPVEPCPKKPVAPRKGKSHLSLHDLKKAQKQGRRQPSLRGDETEENEPVPSTSGMFPSQRPARQSATRFKKMLEEGLLTSAVDSQSVSSDEEDDAPKAKRRRSSSTRRRLNSDSDRSSISEDAMKYRERRDRNNLSSKRSRQKRKMQHVMKQKELKELEAINTSLRLKSQQLETVLIRVKTAWADYLAHMKDNDKDIGDEH